MEPISCYFACLFPRLTIWHCTTMIFHGEDTSPALSFTHLPACSSLWRAETVLHLFLTMLSLLGRWYCYITEISPCVALYCKVCQQQALLIHCIWQLSTLKFPCQYRYTHMLNAHWWGTVLGFEQFNSTNNNVWWFPQTACVSTTGLSMDSLASVASASHWGAVASSKALSSSRRV